MDPRVFINLLVAVLQDAGIDDEDREHIYYRFMERFAEDISSCESELLEWTEDVHYHDDAFEAAMRELHPEWFSEEPVGAED